MEGIAPSHHGSWSEGLKLQVSVVEESSRERVLVDEHLEASIQEVAIDNVGAYTTSHIVGGLQHDEIGNAVAMELISTGQTRSTGSDNDNLRLDHIVVGGCLAGWSSPVENGSETTEYPSCSEMSDLAMEGRSRSQSQGADQEEDEGQRQHMRSLHGLITQPTVLLGYCIYNSSC